ncbi:cupin domain-containing protein [Microbacterium yannicii]|uniref:cupin domain-containing protein n=1 Tax=Microbacterium yannicii TaxID=671622 RepID=UPI0002D6AD7E|nr:cupin domain-containing protein [Microbacterium yannicii]
MTDDDWHKVGERIREARIAAGLSVRELARRMGVSPSHVSQVERGIGSFSVPTLYTVVRELGLSVGDLIPAPVISPAASPSEREREIRDTPQFVLRKESRPTIRLSNGPRWDRLTPQNEPDVEFLEVTYEPGTGGHANHIQHDGREYGVVIEGELSVEVEGTTAVLQAGDSIVFDSQRRHRFWNGSSVAVRAVWFVRDRAGSTVPHV